MKFEENENIKIAEDVTCDEEMITDGNFSLFPVLANQSS